MIGQSLSKKQNLTKSQATMCACIQFACEVTKIILGDVEALFFTFPTYLKSDQLGFTL